MRSRTRVVHIHVGRTGFPLRAYSTACASSALRSLPMSSKCLRTSDVEAGISIGKLASSLSSGLIMPHLNAKVALPVPSNHSHLKDWTNNCHSATRITFWPLPYRASPRSGAIWHWDAPEATYIVLRQPYHVQVGSDMVPCDGSYFQTNYTHAMLGIWRSR